MDRITHNHSQTFRVEEELANVCVFLIRLICNICLKYEENLLDTLYFSTQNYRSQWRLSQQYVPWWLAQGAPGCPCA